MRGLVAKAKSHFVMRHDLGIERRDAAEVLSLTADVQAAFRCSYCIMCLQPPT